MTQGRCNYGNKIKNNFIFIKIHIFKEPPAIHKKRRGEKGGRRVK
nr:MAG TPA_asm: hypothetical protein [Caudoviricetes sp.]